MQEAARLWFENFPSPLNHAKVSSLSSDKVIKSSLSVPVQINTELSMTLIFTACIKDVKHSIRKDLKVFQEVPVAAIALLCTFPMGPLSVASSPVPAFPFPWAGVEMQDSLPIFCI